MKRKDNINIFHQNLGKSLNDINLKYEIIQDDKSLNIDELTIGLISVFSVSNPPSFMLGKELIEELSPLLADNEMIHYFLDSDFISDDIQKKLFASTKWEHFESCWIENGEIQKIYKYGHELEPFLLFVKNRIKQIIDILNNIQNNSFKAYVLDSKKKNFGIENEAFDTSNEALILSKSKYKGHFLFDLMKYQKKGHYYLFEDDKIIIYDATTPSYLSSCFVRLKIKTK